MSEHKRNKDMEKVDTTDYSATTTDARVLKERAAYARPGFFLRGAVWIVSRFPLTRNKYQNWTTSRTIIVGWLLWLIVLPIIPIVAALIWYIRDPESFKKSPWAKALLALAVAWAGYAGVILTNPSQANVNGKYSPIQTQPNGEVAGKMDATNTASAESKDKIANQKESKASNGQKFENCTQAFEAGVFNIKRSDASYLSKLDRDSDGIACEK
ncbi:excalibur calcium-binding domain-containing protein [Candidatus Saccharibacteria bacterium]|nr:excalibur calcium-binding domain-containing protein [Candidatus Saccharibacteria bacterium]